MQHGNHGGSKAAPYVKLAAMIAASYVLMYILMYAMVDRFGNVFHSVNQIYMAGLMTAPMLVLELALMGAMYPDRRINGALIVTGLGLLAACWFAIRNQAAIDDRQFLRSMIPHHAGAILMCKEANLADRETRELCVTIVKGQQQEVDQMKAILARLP